MIPDIGQIILFFLIFARVMSFIGVSIFFGHPSIPLQTKIGFGVALSMVLYPVLAHTVTVPQPEIVALTVIVVKEVLTGLIIGFATGILFAGFQFAGDLIGIDMGFSLATVFDPENGGNVPVIGSVNYIIAILIFVVMDGHHFLIQALHFSYTAVPVDGLVITGQAVQKLVAITGSIFIVAMKISAPVLVALFLTNVCLGIMSRAVPQMNIFMLSFPLKLGVGFYVLIASMPLFALVLQKLLVGFESDLLSLIKVLSHG